jgi:hypothetical protein
MNKKQKTVQYILKRNENAENSALVISTNCWLDILQVKLIVAANGQYRLVVIDWFLMPDGLW